MPWSLIFPNLVVPALVLALVVLACHCFNVAQRRGKIINSAYLMKQNDRFYSRSSYVTGNMPVFNISFLLPILTWCSFSSLLCCLRSPNNHTTHVTSVDDAPIRTQSWIFQLGSQWNCKLGTTWLLACIFRWIVSSLASHHFVHRANADKKILETSQSYI